MSKYSVTNLNTASSEVLEKDIVFKIYGEYLNERLFAKASAVTIVTEEKEFLRFVPLEESEEIV